MSQAPTSVSLDIDRKLLAPDDAFYVRSPPSYANSNHGSTTSLLNVPRSSRDQRRKRSRSRRKQQSGRFKKLLWVKQDYPDNYTDEETFLDHLQRNPRLQPYDFWPLVTDSTVIVQQVCTMIVFVCCFSGIIQERVSPVVVVSWGTLSAVFGWALWDMWIGREEALKASEISSEPPVWTESPHGSKDVGLGLNLPLESPMPPRKTPVHSRNPSDDSIRSEAPSDTLTRNQQRLATAKSAILIYCALLGLSPILKSLTKSTASDSIWAIGFWLMCINVFFFDYGTGPGANFPASLSTNAALMASTVLASRLPSTTHVFSLTLFSIEVFGLFPVFRRYLRHFSWRGHLWLTGLLVMAAGGGTAVSFSKGGWKIAMLGIFLGCLLTGLAMGLCSWWLIGLQRYKNEIHGPWDPARPIIRRRWD